MQTGKKLGKYTINRGAELAIYAVLAEQLKAQGTLKVMKKDSIKEK